MSSCCSLKSLTLRWLLLSPFEHFPTDVNVKSHWHHHHCFGEDIVFYFYHLTLHGLTVITLRQQAKGMRLSGTRMSFPSSHISEHSRYKSRETWSSPFSKKKIRCVATSCETVSPFLHFDDINFVFFQEFSQSLRLTLLFFLFFLILRRSLLIADHKDPLTTTSRNCPYKQVWLEKLRFLCLPGRHSVGVFHSNYAHDRHC